MANLFAKAKAKGATAPSKTEKTTVEINDPLFHNNLSRLAEVEAEISELGAEAGILKSEVKERGIQEFQKLYDSELKFPGSFNIKAVAEGLHPSTFLFIAADRYIKIDEERFEELSKKYGEEIVEENTTYTMDSKLVEKYAEEISEMINSSTKIPQADKDKLISATVSYTVKKGTIQDLKSKYNTKPVTEVLGDIKPVYSIKNVKIEKE